MRHLHGWSPIRLTSGAFESDRSSASPLSNLLNLGALLPIANMPSGMVEVAKVSGEREGEL
jgi:hypothetical protein